MPQWSNNDVASNSVSWAPTLFNVTANSANKTAFYANTTVGAFVGGLTVGQVGVNTAEMANTTNDNRFSQHAGWNVRKVGTGSIISIAVSAGGTGYANSDLLRVTAPTGTGTVNATGTLTTNATGGIATVTLTTSGAGFVTVNPTVTVTNATGGATAGSTANLVATAGGRAGRISYETIVASGTIS